MVKTFPDAVKFIERYIPTPDKKHPGSLGLSRMQYLMDLLDNPQLKYPTIHVGGTSGKGSTATIIASILSTKYKVGLHTSPHLVDIRERIIIYGPYQNHNFAEVGKNFSVHLPNSRQSSVSGGLKVLKTVGVLEKLASPQNIPQRKFVYLLNKIIPVIKKIEKSGFGAPSYFEIVTAMAFLYFYRQKVEIAVIEVGMGGRFDATNVIKPLVAVLTNVGLDHTEILGDTVEKIARDKVGIIKSRIQVVSGVKQKSVIKIIESRITKYESRFSLLDRDFGYKIKSMTGEGSVFDYMGNNTYKNLKLNLIGDFQVENAALAVRVIELLGNAPRPPLKVRGGEGELYIRDGLKNAYIPGRLEIIRRNPLVILDGAHNPDKMRALVTSIIKIFPKKKVTAIIAIKEDKNAKEMFSQLLKISNKVIFTKFQLKGDVGIINSYDPKLLLQTAQNINMPHRYGYSHSGVERRRKEMRIIENPKKAITKAMEMALENDLILVTGSLYLIGEVKKFLISEHSHSRESRNLYIKKGMDPGSSPG